jgi:hypothetical protein
MEMLTFKQFVEKHCWKGYVKRGMKKKGKRMVNNCVKEDVEHRLILGVTEVIDIKNIGMVEAKIDSGNEAYNVLLGLDIKHHGRDCSFTTVNNKRITLPCTGKVDINIGSGNIESRPTVELDFTLQGKQYTGITFSLADRSQNDQPVLIGEPFIKKINALIDVKQEA